VNSGVIDLHAAKHHFHRHGRQRLIALLTGKHAFADLRGRKAFKD
jgi:hypothetical protein